MDPWHAVSSALGRGLSDSLAGAGWLALTDLSARPTNRWEVVRDVNSGHGARYYRLVTPAVP